jgi:hypothetical protein
MTRQPLTLMRSVPMGKAVPHTRCGGGASDPVAEEAARAGAEEDERGLGE